jgi:hypothetical protein
MSLGSDDSTSRSSFASRSEPRRWRHRLRPCQSFAPGATASARLASSEEFFSKHTDLFSDPLVRALPFGMALV